MKRILLLFLCLLFSFTLCACAKETKEPLYSSVTINLPSDNTVNGYRENTETSNDNATHKPTVDSTISNNTVSENPVFTNSANTETNETSTEFCANKNSKVFHNSSCGSVKTMKEENKYFSSDRDSLINEGYIPCKRCNP